MFCFLLPKDTQAINNKTDVHQKSRWCVLLIYICIVRKCLLVVVMFNESAM